jgi:hypothetical protein
VSEASEAQAGKMDTLSSATRGQGPKPLMLDNFPCPSKEALLTLLWALKVEERKLGSVVAASQSDPGGNISPASNVETVLRDKKRGRPGYVQGLTEKRRRRLG